MNNLIVTLDLDWACEPAIEETLAFLKDQHIPVTVFVTHYSSIVENNMHELEVGLHPFFAPHSSHGATITEVVKYIMDLPHNLAAFRCHRFASCNVSRQAMAEAGLLISSNVCTDLEILLPFRDRFGLLEVPVFLEDGGYLWRKHPLEIHPNLIGRLQEKGNKVIIIHPMHFALNTPHFDYMYNIKQNINRHEWNNMSHRTLHTLRWKKRGIRDFLIELLQLVPKKSYLSSLITTS